MNSYTTIVKNKFTEVIDSEIERKKALPSRLITLLEVKREELKQNDLQFAQTLGIGQSHWCMAKSGQRKIGLKLLQAIIRNFGEFTPDVLIYIRDGEF